MIFSSSQCHCLQSVKLGLSVWLMQTTWNEARSKLEKDSLGRASNPDLDAAEKERVFRAHIDGLYSVCFNRAMDFMPAHWMLVVAMSRYSLRLKQVNNVHYKTVTYFRTEGVSIPVYLQKVMLCLQSI